MPEPTVERIVDTILGYRKAKILLVAAQLDCFTHLERPRTAGELAQELSLDPRATEILLDALVAMGYLRKSGGLYRNTPVGSRHLVRGRPGYMGDNLKYQDIIWDAWSELRRCVRKGGAVRPLDYWLLRHRGFTQDYIRGMSNIAARPAAEIAALVPMTGARRMLDVGAGPGTYSLAFLRRNPELRATLLDLPTALKVSREFLRGEPDLSRRVNLRAGDYRRDRFGRAEFDLILLSHVTHDESPRVNRRLLTQSHRALRPGGRVIIHDFMVDANRTTPQFGALFAVHMLTYTSGGRTYRASEYESWLKTAGFIGARRHRIAAGARNFSQVIVARKN